MKIIIQHQFLVLALLLILPSVISGQQTNSNVEIQNEIDYFLNAGIENGFSGSILIAKEGEIILNKGYGEADKENGIVFTAQTVSPIGSVTKQFTATAILKLVELEKVSINDPISHFFDNIPKDKMDITIHQLLTHSSGLIGNIGEGDFEDIQREKFFKKLFKSKLQYQPGTKYAYSNVGYSILARIIELCSGEEYEDFLYENLFKPAGMSQTGYFIPKWDGDTIAKGYAFGAIGVGSMIQKYREMGKVSWNLKGNGGIHSTAEDMYKWSKALQSNQIISKSSFDKLTQRHIKENESGTSYYGYGWAIYESNNNTKIISHNGGNSIFFHDFIWLPKEDVVIIFFTNGASKEVEVAWKIKKMIFDTSYIADPIKMNLHLLAMNYMKTKSFSEAGELIDQIKKVYLPSITRSYMLNDLGYDLLRLETDYNKEWALEIFKLNVELFPDDGNIWDSLGEAYLKIGKRELALKSYKKAIDLAPASNCSWCQSSKKAINKLK